MLATVEASSVLSELKARLTQSGAVSEQAWERGERAQKETGDRIDRVLVKLGLAPEGVIADTLADILDMRRIAASEFPSEPVELGAVSFEFLRANQVVPLDDDGEILTVAVADPLDPFCIEAFEKAMRRRVEPVLGLSSDILTALERLYRAGATKRAAGDASATGVAGADDVERLRDLASEAPVIRLVNDLIEGAIRAGASDVHVQPNADGVRVRYRLDGMLRDHATFPPHEAQALISRIKIMSRLNIAERRLPQDGRIKTTSRGREIDLRVSTVPSMDSEAVVLRILDRDSQPTSVAELGFSQSDQRRLEALTRSPNGLFLVTGPTGSGKTTTLYATLLDISKPELKVVTVEDPIEYRLLDAVQMQIKPDIGLTFATALRSFLRHDPDVIMVGEIRDGETAEIAVQAALTGHLVFSTLHTNSAAAAVSRLLDMGVEDYLLGSALIGTIAQRLVRRLCRECRRPMPAPRTGPVAERLLQLTGGAEPELWGAVGCSSCNHTGYSGRRAILEVMPATDEIRRLILDRAPAQKIEACAVEQGMVDLLSAGLQAALDGETTLDEVARVTREA